MARRRFPGYSGCFPSTHERQPVRTSKTLAKLRSGRPVRLCSLGHFIPAYIRHAAHFGYDCIWLDLEHRAMTDREVQALLAYFHAFDIDCMLRPATLEKTRLYRYLEDGATGLLIPHVSTPEKAQMLVNAIKFPPLGDRGLDGASMDSDFLLQGGEDYIDAANRETFLVVQIETPEAVANVDAIAAVDGVDGMFIGTSDLGLRIRRSGVDLTLEQAIQTVADAAERRGKAWGLPADSPEHLRRYHAQGARLAAYGGDFMALMEMLKRSAADLDEVYGT
jgi:4-hydroxy-2-oxoheptanedioate aldolase